MKKQIKLISAIAATIILSSCSHDTTCYCKIQDVNGVKYPTAKYPLGKQYKRVAENKCQNIELSFKKNGQYDKDKTSCNIEIYKENCGGVYGGL